MTVMTVVLVLLMLVVVMVVLVLGMALMVARGTLVVAVVIRQLVEELPLPPVLETPAFTTAHPLIGTRDRREPSLPIADRAVVVGRGQWGA